jgi:hypothetical protein
LGAKIEQELGGVIAYNTLMRYLDDKYKQTQKRSPQGNPMEKSIEKSMKHVTEELQTPEALREGFENP